MTLINYVCHCSISKCLILETGVLFGIPEKRDAGPYEDHGPYEDPGSYEDLGPYENTQ